MWQPLSNFVLTSDWQISQPIIAKNFRLTHTFSLNESEYQPMALLALARLDENNKLEIFNPQRIIPREESEIIQFSLLSFEWQYSIAIKLLVAPSRLSTQWSLQIDMPLYSTIFNPDLSEGCDIYNRQDINMSGSNYIKVLEANATRRRFRITNNGNMPLYIGMEAEFGLAHCLAVIPPQGIYVDDIGWKSEVYANLFSTTNDTTTVSAWEYGITSEFVPTPVEGSAT